MEHGITAYESIRKSIARKDQQNEWPSIQSSGKFIEVIKHKAENARSYAKSVNPNHRSPLYSNCGTGLKKEIHHRSPDCPVCGLSLHEDRHAARNILKSGIDTVFQMSRQSAAS